MTTNYLSILAETIRTNWDQPALTDFYLTEDGTAQDTSRGNHYTYGGMYAELCRVADMLTSLGLQKGDHIAICGANSAHWVIAYLAVAKMQGIVATILHTRLPEDIISQIEFSDAKALFTDEEIWGEISPRLGSKELCSIECPMDIHRTKKGGEVAAVLSLANWSLLDGNSDRAMTERQPREDREITFPRSEPDDLAMICFTSGTTESPKGIMLSYGNLENNIIDTKLIYPNTKSSNILSLFPFGHMLGLHFELLSQLSFGKNIHLFCDIKTTDNLFNAYKIVKPYAIASAPLLIKSIVDRYPQAFFDLLFQSCKYIIFGGAKLNEEIVYKMIQDGIGVTNAYGMSETGAIISGSTSATYKYPSCGKVLQGNKIRISPAGEILVKGENVMLGYYKDPEATAAKIDSDGWLHTGDKGHLDEDGYLYVEGRLEQDIIVLPNGENIRPDNIESLINALPEVSESIVLVRDGKLVAIVVPNPSYKVDNIEEFSRKILYAINPQLPLYSQLYGLEISPTPLARTEKQTIKRYLYK
ncbi:MAG: AMP-binding protein [Paludibacteraceae bacterium]|nr:AMP-binding protein [Paludibacteraceae bacterium]